MTGPLSQNRRESDSRIEVLIERVGNLRGEVTTATDTLNKVADALGTLQLNNTRDGVDLRARSEANRTLIEQVRSEGIHNRDNAVERDKVQVELMRAEEKARKDDMSVEQRARELADSAVAAQAAEALRLAGIAIDEKITAIKAEVAAIKKDVKPVGQLVWTNRILIAVVSLVTSAVVVALIDGRITVSFH